MSAENRLMGIDYGEKRIGVAFSDPLGIIASPHAIIDGRPGRSALQALSALAQEHGACKIIVGLPTDSEDNVGAQAETVIRWARKLAKTVAQPIVFWDESHSTEEAAALSQSKKRRKDLDAVAAAVILQSYLEARRSSDEPGQPLHQFDELV